VSSDPVVERLRDQIAAVDRGLVDAVNRRLELVAELWRHKEAHGLPMLAPDREQAMIAHLTEHNRGPLSAEGLKEFYAGVLALTKRELG
jgi:chorismate mutase